MPWSFAKRPFFLPRHSWSTQCRSCKPSSSQDPSSTSEWTGCGHGSTQCFMATTPATSPVHPQWQCGENHVPSAPSKFRCSLRQVADSGLSHRGQANKSTCAYCSVAVDLRSLIARLELLDKILITEYCRKELGTTAIHPNVYRLLILNLTTLKTGLRGFLNAD